ncbi:hypothetical protein RRG08_004189 [Elysia crispata]|uniref:Uncharacterized protein n=1 Tax=Elysia crispata TaxID=231223 RepID=A0AAE1D5R4_9GAST|nr:hypothetical protein RRG08_004189 [Elysia crispata]
MIVQTMNGKVQSDKRCLGLVLATHKGMRLERQMPSQAGFIDGRCHVGASDTIHLTIGRDPRDLSVTLTRDLSLTSQTSCSLTNDV